MYTQDGWVLGPSHGKFVTPVEYIHHLHTSRQPRVKANTCFRVFVLPKDVAAHAADPAGSDIWPPPHTWLWLPWNTESVIPPNLLFTLEWMAVLNFMCSSSNRQWSRSTARSRGSGDLSEGWEEGWGFKPVHNQASTVGHLRKSPVRGRCIIANPVLWPQLPNKLGCGSDFTEDLDSAVTYMWEVKAAPSEKEKKRKRSLRNLSRAFRVHRDLGQIQFQAVVRSGNLQTYPEATHASVFFSSLYCVLKAEPWPQNSKWILLGNVFFFPVFLCFNLFTFDLILQNCPLSWLQHQCQGVGSEPYLPEIPAAPLTWPWSYVNLCMRVGETFHSSVKLHFLHSVIHGTSNDTKKPVAPVSWSIYISTTSFGSAMKPR